MESRLIRSTVDQHSSHVKNAGHSKINSTEEAKTVGNDTCVKRAPASANNAAVHNDEREAMEADMTRDSFAVGTLVQLNFQNAGGEVLDDICAKVTGASDSAISLKTIEGVDGTMVVCGASIEPGTLLVFRFGGDMLKGPSTWGGEVIVVGKVTGVSDDQVQMKTYRSAEGFMEVGGKCSRPLDGYDNPFGEKK